MNAPWCVNAYWSDRREAISTIAARLHLFSRELAALSPALARLYPRTRDDSLVQPLTGAPHAEALLAHWEVRWRVGSVERRAYTPSLVLDRVDDPAVIVSCSVGVDPVDLRGVWAPDRVEVRVRADAGDDLASAEVLLGVLMAMQRAFEPDWAFAGREGDPSAPSPLFSKGAPVAAWALFLSSRYAVDAGAFTAPSAAYSVGDRGTLVLAHRGLPVRGLASHRAALDHVAEALRGVSLAR